MPQHRFLGGPSLGALALAGLLAACGGAPERPAVQTTSSIRGTTPPGPPGDPWGPWIREASRRFDVPDRWIREVMRQESGGRASATSPVGAMGLMQVMPGTYAELRRRHNLGPDPYHPYDNLMAGAAYIRQMYDLYGSPAFLAAYNAGPRRLEDYLYNSRGLPTETRNYVARVGPGVLRASPSRPAPAEVYAAGEIPLTIPPGPRRMDPSTRTMLAEQRAIRQGNVQFASRAEPEPPPRPGERGAAARAFAEAGPSLAETGGGLVGGTSLAHTGGGLVAAPRGGFVPGSVRAMDPIPDGSTPEGAARLAESAAREERVIVARMDPIPDGATPEGAARLAESAARAASEPAPLPRPMPDAARAMAQAGAPSGSFLVSPQARGGFTPQARGNEGTAQARSADSVLRSLPAPARPVAAPPILTPPVPPRSLGFIAVAQAGTLPTGFRPAIAPQWGVQVGAFASQNLARSAAQQAQGALGSGGGRVAVEPVAVGRSTLYRARLLGLSQTAAQQACDRLRARGGCQVVSPEG